MQPEQIEKDLMGRDDPHELRPSQLITAIQRITKQRYQLAADNQRLREALKRNRQGYQNILESRQITSGAWGNGYGERYGALTREELEEVISGIKSALAATPADFLEAYRRKVLEEAANAVRKECEVYSEFQNENAVLMAAAEVIRRMAGEAKDAS